MKGVKLSLVTLFISILVVFTSLANEGLMWWEDPNDKGNVCTYINAEGHAIKNEWKQVSEKWFYFGEDGRSKQKTWAEIDGKWYYFDNFSIMLHDTTTPDGYYVGSDGAWIEGVTADTVEAVGPAQ